MSIEVMRQALAVLEEINKLSIGENAICLPAEIDTAMDALRQAIEQAEQAEPVAWVCYGSATNEKHAIDYDQTDIDDIPVGTMLYTAPPQRQPLTEEEIRDFYGDNNNFDITGPYVIAFARAIEAAHGIKGEA